MLAYRQSSFELSGLTVKRFHRENLGYVVLIVAVSNSLVLGWASTIRVLHQLKYEGYMLT